MLWGHCQRVARVLGRVCVILQVLYERLHEADSKKMVQQMENNLQMLESSMDNVLKTAEMLGAAHQVPYEIKHLKPKTSHHSQ